MTLGIDLIGTNLESGTKTFNLNFLNQIINSKNNKKTYIFICKHYLKYINIKKIPKNISLSIKSNFLSKSFFKIIWMQIIFPFELKILKINKIYSPMNYCPFLCKVLNIKIILNIHSNLPWVFYNKMPGSKIKNYLIKIFMYLSIKFCEKLIVNSIFAKNEIKKKLKIKSSKIFVNYLGVDNVNSLKNNKKDSIKFNFKLNYILCVSSCVRYHDFFNILTAYKKINEKNNIKFILITQKLDQKYFNEIKKFINANFKKKEIYVFHNINYGLVEKFYNNALFYIFSSYCEVFGLTSLEAMKNKCPVLISRSSALPEINGNAALYFNPLNVGELIFKMNKLIKSHKLRNSLILKGNIHVKKFKWIYSYKNLMSIIETNNNKI